MDLNYIGKMFLVLFLVLESLYLFSLFKKGQREAVRKANVRLEELRTKPMKTIEEQREFINLKYPKKEPFKLSWMFVPSFIFSTAKFLGLSFIFYYLLKGIDIPFWFSMVICFTGPFILNIILRKFNLNKGDSTDIFFKPKKKKGEVIK